VCLYAGLAAAQGANPPAGEYIFERGSGLLNITQYKVGDKAACLKTLQPLAEDAARTDADIKEGYPPADAEDYLPIVKATRFNLKMCKG
jgi:hypothetical protein